MKKTFVFLFAFVAFLSFAQNKNITFIKQIDYGIVSSEIKKVPSNAYFTMLGNNSGEFLSQTQITYFPIAFFTDNLGTMSVRIGLGNKLNYSNIGDVLGTSGIENDRVQKYTAKKLSTKETVLGISCNHYLLSFQKEKKEDEYGDSADKNLKLCIDERNSLNNYSVLLGVSEMFDRTKITGDKLNGLILKFGSEKNYDKEFLVAKSIKDINETVYFDHKAAIVMQKKMQDSMKTAMKLRQEEWAKEEAAYAVADFAVAVVDSAVAVVDSAAAAYDDSYAYLEKYQTAYKKDQHGDGNYAIDNVPSENAWNALPSYCKNPSKDLPKLQNSEFVKHLKNYSSQICDIYLAQSRDHNVDIKGTMDEIRREVLFFDENKPKLSKDDQQKVEKYLRNLD